MGIGGMSVGSLLIILLIIVLLFGTKRVRNIGSDLGAALRGFQQGLQGDNAGGQSTTKPIPANKQQEKSSEQ